MTKRFAFNLNPFLSHSLCWPFCLSLSISQSTIKLNSWALSLSIPVFAPVSFPYLFGRRDLRACLIVLFPGRRLRKSARISDMSLDSSTAGNVLVTIASSKMEWNHRRREAKRRGVKKSEEKRSEEKKR